MLRRNVLIFQTGGLGDFVLTWPFAVALGRIYPQSRIIYVSHQQKGDLARRLLRLESTDIEAGWHGLFAENGTLPTAAQKIIESAHAVYTFLPASPLWHSNVERLNPHARRIQIDTRIGLDFQGHLTDQIVASLGEFPPEKSALEQMLRSIADRGIGYKTTGGSDIVIHPGSGSPTKCWPMEHFLALANQLKISGRNVRFVIGEVELENWSDKDREQLKAHGSLRTCATYLNLLEELQTAAGFIGNDSGPAHLAGIIALPTIALFGPTNPTQWKPLGPRVRVLQNASVDEVFSCIANSPEFSRASIPLIATSDSSDDDE